MTISPHQPTIILPLSRDQRIAFDQDQLAQAGYHCTAESESADVVLTCVLSTVSDTSYTLRWRCSPRYPADPPYLSVTESGFDNYGEIYERQVQVSLPQLVDWHATMTMIDLMYEAQLHIQLQPQTQQPQPIQLLNTESPVWIDDLPKMPHPGNPSGIRPTAQRYRRANPVWKPLTVVVGLIWMTILIAMVVGSSAGSRFSQTATPFASGQVAATQTTVTQIAMAEEMTRQTTIAKGVAMTQVALTDISTTQALQAEHDAATATASVIQESFDLIKQQGRLIANDDFANNHNKWDIRDDDVTKRAIKNGVLSITMFASGTYHWDTWTKRQTDFAAELDVTALTTGAGGGLIFGYQDDANHYFLGMSEQSYILAKKVNNEWEVIASSSVPTMQPSPQTNRLAVVRRGAMLSIFINNMLVTELQDETFLSGNVGVMASSGASESEVLIDNFRLWSLS